MGTEEIYRYFGVRAYYRNVDTIQYCGLTEVDATEYVGTNTLDPLTARSNWLLRTPGRRGGTVYMINGKSMWSDEFVGHVAGIRPALWLKLDE